MAVPKFTAPPEPGHVVEFAGRRFGFISSEAGRYMGRDYVKLAWSGACRDCSAGFVQGTSLTPRRFATRCKACDPHGEKDAADRKAYVGARAKAPSRAPDSAIVPPRQTPSTEAPDGEAFTLTDARIEGGWLQAVLTFPDDDPPEPLDVSWRPGSRGFDTPGLNDALAALHAELEAESLL